MDMKNGRLGCTSLFLLNRTLLGKWSRGYVSKGDGFWKQIIKGKYGKEEVCLILLHGERWLRCWSMKSYKEGV